MHLRNRALIAVVGIAAVMLAGMPTAARRQ
jgi:hypothetical protein